ncbi:hypothetical protein [Amphritea balenae]|uniref:Uncharacterized protein n=1 Tax=Amphritea balenae TaxID=452629 RepID=A0A3P1SPE7_9GAMM|nr:hypothetical protein [Amphritea balenae]RRC99003.1 hypothetical protein EHS89_12610 [Amphritea balenae]GGK63604.1 hypothetical protein GCM10007941_12180 [Amphritea balenae]
MAVDKKQIRADRWLKMMMRTGVPVAIVSILCLWLGHLLSEPAFGSVFLITMPIALVIGFSYNLRYVMLAVRARKAEQD